MPITVIGRRVERRGKLLDDEIEQSVDADRLGGRTDDHRRETRVGEAELGAAHDVFLRERALLEVLLDQGVVGLSNRLDELLAGRVGHLVDLVGPLRFLGLGTGRIEIGLLVQEVGDPRELVLRADRQLERRDLVPERRDELVERALEVGPLPVELVHEDRPRKPRLDRELPRRLGLDLDAVDRRDHDDDGIDGADR